MRPRVDALAFIFNIRHLQPVLGASYTQEIVMVFELTIED